MIMGKIRGKIMGFGNWEEANVKNKRNGKKQISIVIQTLVWMSKEEVYQENSSM